MDSKNFKCLNMLKYLHLLLRFYCVLNSRFKVNSPRAQKYFSPAFLYSVVLISNLIPVWFLCLKILFLFFLVDFVIPPHSFTVMFVLMAFWVRLYICFPSWPLVSIVSVKTHIFSLLVLGNNWLLFFSSIAYLPYCLLLLEI